MDNTRPPTAPRALLIGGGAADAEWLASRLPPGGEAIAFADRAAAAAVKAVFAQHRIPAAVMLGDPVLLIHKVAGPFDLIVDAHPGHQQRRERLTALLTAGGQLAVRSNAETDDGRKA